MNSGALSQKSLPSSRTFDVLFGNFQNHDYYDGADYFPLNTDDEDFSPCHAWWMAETSLLSYVDSETWIGEQLQKTAALGWRLVEYSGIRCLLVRYPGVGMLVFRGTLVEKPENLVTDVRFFRTVFGSQGKVHSGFYQGLLSVWRPLRRAWRELFQGGEKIIFGGHSLGGALATLAFSRLARPGSGDGLYVFGCPRVGDDVFAKRFNGHAYRVVNNNDFVDQLPPAGMYRHVGRLIYLDRHGRVRLDISDWQRFKDGIKGNQDYLGVLWGHWRQGDMANIPFDWLADHSPFHYAIHLWNHLLDSATAP